MSAAADGAKRLAEIERLFHEARARPAAGRAAFLADACSEDEALRQEVESLLAQHASAPGPLDGLRVPAMSDGGAPALKPGQRLGAYEVVELIDVGGMGEVYRARDTSLFGREVAVKILPGEFTGNPDRLARFTREAKSLATLSHPNIATIHEFASVDGTYVLVMELVAGETLAARLANGPLPLADALALARQIADALDAAHEQGIVHRDLKPANIKVRPDGAAKLLDFGLAKAFEHVAASIDPSRSPALSNPALTRVGTVVGTAAYMSPEQARGQPADKRSDVWAFGCVLFEMLTGKRAFEADGTSDTLATVLRAEPDWSLCGPRVPQSITTLLKRCLEKDHRRRLRDIGDARLELDARVESATPPPEATDHRRRERFAWAATVTALLVLALGLGAWAIRAVRYEGEAASLAPPETRVDIVTPATDEPSSFALSPDGRQIVFVASGDGTSRLWLRSLATTTAQSLPGTEGATSPFWSPDSRSIGFYAGNSLKRLDLAGGAPQTLAGVAGGLGGAWSADGVILFSSNQGGPLKRVSASGGAVVAVTTLGPGDRGHFSPWFLPGGQRFVFSVRGAADANGIFLGALDGSTPTRLTLTDSTGVYLPEGWLLWVRAGTLVAQRLDVARAALTEEPITLADGVATDIQGRSAVSAAATGLVAYRTSAGNRRQLAWIERSGKALGMIGAADGSGLSNPRVSPDGRRVAMSRTVQGNTDIWLLEGARTSRLTFDSADDVFPFWSPDGARIVFRLSRPGSSDIYYKLTRGAGVEEPLVVSDQRKTPTSWSVDGRILYHSIDPQTGPDLWVASSAGDRTPAVFLKTSSSEGWGTFSPNGRWVAYHSDESGQREIYIRPFVTPGAASATAVTARGQLQVSTEGGIYPVWRPDGKELYFLNPTGAMMAAPITVKGSTLEPGAPVMLFPTRIVGGGVDVQQGRQYDVAPDGRFLINTAPDEVPAPITLLQNWNPAAKK